VSCCQEAERAAERFLQDRNVSLLPINPFKIASDLNILVQAKSSVNKGVSGMLIRNGNDFGIVYATHINNEGFQRFCIGHELGHYLLPGHVDALLGEKQIHESHAGFVSENKYEKEADSFAAGLLMPAFLFQKAQRKAGDGLNAIEFLAKEHMTSLTATAIRYTQFTDSPAAVILSEGQLIKWCSLSGAIKEIPSLDLLKKGDPIPRNTVTHKFDQNNYNILNNYRTDGTMSLQAWFGGEYKIDIIEEVTGLGPYGKTLTIITIEDFDLEPLSEN
jgi:Zn-dependent peptidase ImmA (M78 family)